MPMGTRTGTSPWLRNRKMRSSAEPRPLRQAGGVHVQARRQPSPGGVPGHTALHGDPQKGPRVTQPQHWGRALRGSLCPPSRRAGATGMQPGTFQMLLSQSPRSRTRKEAARGFSFLTSYKCHRYRTVRPVPRTRGPAFPNCQQWGRRGGQGVTSATSGPRRPVGKGTVITLRTGWPDVPGSMGQKPRSCPT